MMEGKKPSVHIWPWVKNLSFIRQLSVDLNFKKPDHQRVGHSCKL